MKINTLKQQIKTTVVVGVAASCLGTFAQPSHAADEAEISISDHSFEDNHLDNNGDPLDAANTSELGSLSNAWTPYGIDGEIQVGTLFANHSEDSNLYVEPTPDGNRVLILFNSDASGGAPFGVEQELTDIEGGCRYTLTVDVGNIATNNDSFEGFPIYRIQLFAGDMEVPLAQDFASLNIEEGEFETATLIVEIREGSPFIDEPLRLRLQNENNALDIVDGVPVANNNNEVNFDNVRLTTEPYSPSAFYYATGSPEKIDIASPYFFDENPVEINFDIQGGSKSIFVYGRGNSLDTTATDVAADPDIRIIDRQTGLVLHESDNWGFEDQAGGIIDYENMMNYAGTHQFMNDQSATDAALMVTLESGEYAVQLSSKGEENVYAGVKIFERALGSTGTISYPSDAELELKQFFDLKFINPKLKLRRLQPTQIEQTRTKLPLRSISAFKK